MKIQNWRGISWWDGDESTCPFCYHYLCFAVTVALLLIAIGSHIFPRMPLRMTPCGTVASLRETFCGENGILLLLDTKNSTKICPQILKFSLVPPANCPKVPCYLLVEWRNGRGAAFWISHKRLVSMHLESRIPRCWTLQILPTFECHRNHVFPVQITKCCRKENILPLLIKTLETYKWCPCTTDY